MLIRVKRLTRLWVCRVPDFKITAYFHGKKSIKKLILLLKKLSWPPFKKKYNIDLSTFGLDLPIDLTVQSVVGLTSYALIYNYCRITWKTCNKQVRKARDPKPRQLYRH